MTYDQLVTCLGETRHDVYLNDRAYWRCVPARVWKYTIGGYQVMMKWLSYRERPLLGRDLKPDEARYVTEIARRLAAILLLEPALDANHERMKAELLLRSLPRSQAAAVETEVARCGRVQSAAPAGPRCQPCAVLHSGRQACRLGPLAALAPRRVSPSDGGLSRRLRPQSIVRHMAGQATTGGPHPCRPLVRSGLEHEKGPEGGGAFFQGAGAPSARSL
jgi:hypothetical protein